jgi:hypothetical protein
MGGKLALPPQTIYQPREAETDRAEHSSEGPKTSDIRGALSFSCTFATHAENGGAAQPYDERERGDRRRGEAAPITAGHVTVCHPTVMERGSNVCNGWKADSLVCRVSKLHGGSVGRL